MRHALGTLNFLYRHKSTTEGPRSVFDAYVEECKKDGRLPLFDTAYYYGDTQTDALVGMYLRDLDTDFEVSGKANPWSNNDFESGSLGQLSQAGLRRQINASLKNLGIPKFRTFFLHAYDHETPLSETLETVDDLYRQEKFDSFGVSNFSAKNVLDVSEGLEFLTVDLSDYQGMYNMVCRKVQGVIPLVRDLGLTFWAYNLLAGGLLTGRYKDRSILETEPGRFHKNQIYQNIFWKPPLLKYVDFLEDPLRDSLGWLSCQSWMEAGDIAVVGASSPKQLTETLGALREPKMPRFIPDYTQDVLDASPEYFY
jgi:aflatoxin B1 aldehyde reductase